MPTPRRSPALLSTIAAVALASSVARAQPAPPPDPPPVSSLPPSAVAEGVDPDLPELLGHLAGITPETHPAPRRFRVVPLPYVLLNPLLGAGGGLALVGGFRLGPADKLYSHFEASGFVTTNHQLGALLRAEIRFPADDWILVSDWGGGRFPNPAWGVGGETQSSDRTIVQRSQLQLHETLYRRIFDHLYGGLGSFVDDFVDIVDTRRAAGETTAFGRYPYGTGDRSFSSGLTLNLLWDGRDSTVAPTRGSYLLGRFRLEPATLGSDDDWSSFYLDGRTYVGIPGRRDVLGFWVFAWSSYGKTPYLLLPQVGGDPEHRSGRGMIEGRYTARDLLYGEVEYRAHLWKTLGAVAAMNLTAPSDRGVGGGAFSFRTVHPGLSTGLRVLLDRASGSNLALDVAWAPEGHVGFYLNANETF